MEERLRLEHEKLHSPQGPFGTNTCKTRGSESFSKSSVFVKKSLPEFSFTCQSGNLNKKKSSQKFTNGQKYGKKRGRSKKKIMFKNWVMNQTCPYRGKTYED